MSSTKQRRRHRAVRIAASCVLTTVCVLTASGTAGAIVNGSDSTEEYPFMAAIPQSAPEHGLLDGTCGASLIDEQWVLTAAHCVTGDGLVLDGIVRVGSDQRASGGTVREIERTVVHPDYVSGAGIAPNENDVALVLLDEPVTEEPVAVAEDSGAPGTATRVIGFGTTVDTEFAFPDRLQELDTLRGAEGECDPGWADDTRLCTTSTVPDAMACFGDSGGPQVREGRDGRWELVGVTSGPGALDVPCSGGPGLYTSAPAHADWIHETITSHGAEGSDPETNDTPDGAGDATASTTDAKDGLGAFAALAAVLAAAAGGTLLAVRRRAARRTA